MIKCIDSNKFSFKAFNFIKIITKTQIHFCKFHVERKPAINTLVAKMLT